MKNKIEKKLNKIQQFLSDCYADSERMGRAFTRTTDENESDNIFPDVTLTSEEFVNMTIDLILGDDWCVVDPLGPKQVNAIAMQDIIEWYRKNHRKEARKKGL